MLAQQEQARKDGSVLATQLTAEELSLLVPDAVTANEIAKVVAVHTGVPVSKLLMEEKDKLIHMEEELHKRIVGQEDAVTAISNCVRVSRAGLHAHNRPTGAFLFIGPSGVGKTELAKTLAEFLFDDRNAMVRIDMSEYMEKHSVSRLIGAPPGYVGYDAGGMLTEAVRRRPYQVVLLDEVEKAHRDVTNVLLQVFDEGHLTDGQGHKVDFRNCIFIMTSNLGAAQASTVISQLPIKEGREVSRDIMMAAVKSHFPPEFLNRLDQVISFNYLTVEDMLPIVDIQLGGLRTLLKNKRIELSVSEEAKRWLANIGYDSTYGARPLKRAIDLHLLNPLSIMILKGDVQDEAAVAVGVNEKENELTIISTAGTNQHRDEHITESSASTQQQVI